MCPQMLDETNNADRTRLHVAGRGPRLSERVCGVPDHKPLRACKNVGNRLPGSWKSTDWMAKWDKSEVTPSVNFEYIHNVLISLLVLSFASQFITTEGMQTSFFSACCWTKSCCWHHQPAGALLLQAAVLCQPRSRAGEKQRWGCSSGQFWFDSISPVLNFKPFPRNISFQCRFLQCSSGNSPSIFPEISPSCFFSESGDFGQWAG